ncbi:MAG: putative bifunctional diguanylate cyclase/phosphodiesterase [Myxococcota bacterium]
MSAERSREFLLHVLDAVDEGIVIIDREERIWFWNRTINLWTGTPASSAIGQRWSALFQEDPGSWLRQAVRDALRSGLSSMFTPALHDSPLPLKGPRLGHRLRQRVLVEPMAECCLIRIQDASELLEREARLAAQADQLAEQKRALIEQQRAIHRAATFDAVTGLLNRTQLRSHLDRSIARAGAEGVRGAVALFDIDGWRSVNESMGTKTADQVLRRIGSRLCREVRPMDVVGRIGGDEFVIVLDDLEPGDARDTARRVMSAIRRPLVINGKELSVTASGGISFFPRHGSDAEGLLIRAEAAMRHAKRLGRNRIQIYSKRLGFETDRRAQLLSSLQKAATRGEFSLHYQPQVALDTGEVEGAEALLRWTHPELGPLSPGQFVPIMEECGLIVPVGIWVLEQAALQAARWRDAGLNLRVAVNVSPHQFIARDFVQTVRSALRTADLEPTLLELELTESTLMHDVDESRRMLRELSELGIQISVDDFGTGYSSLAHLRRFPVDTLKIDRAFTQEVDDEEGQAIVRTIIGLSQILDLRVIAEGVETEEQAGFLRQEGCASAQGFWIGRPMTALAFSEWYRAWTTGQAVLPMEAGSRSSASLIRVQTGA